LIKKRKYKINIIIFTVGAVIFAVFLLSDISEVKTKKKVTDENYGYYARHQPEKDEINHS
tara:strand:- start:282 stop:461 length:180 start_codon:yes stop_codon:yes gene_type:complete